MPMPMPPRTLCFFFFILELFGKVPMPMSSSSPPVIASLGFGCWSWTVAFPSRLSTSKPKPFLSFFLTKAIIAELSGAKRCLSRISLSPPPPESSSWSSRAFRLTLGPIPCPSRQPIFLSNFTPIVSPPVLNMSITGPLRADSSAVDPNPAKESVV